MAAALASNSTLTRLNLANMLACLSLNQLFATSQDLKKSAYPPTTWDDVWNMSLNEESNLQLPRNLASYLNLIKGGCSSKLSRYFRRGERNIGHESGSAAPQAMGWVGSCRQAEMKLGTLPCTQCLNGCLHY